MNDAVKERLSDDQYEAVMEAAEESTAYEKSVFKEAVEKEKEIAVKEYGIVFNEVDIAPFQAAVQPLHDQFKNNATYSELYDMIRAHADAE